MSISKSKTAIAATAIVAAVLLSSCSFTVKQEPMKATRFVEVSGKGSVTVPADEAILSFSVITYNRDVMIASQTNAETVTKIQKTLIDEGFSRESITTADYRISQESQNRNGIQVRGDYRVNNSIRILIKNMDRIGTAIDTAIKAGANNFSSIEFNVSDKDAAVREARTQAVKQAYEAAKLMVSTSGAALGKIITIEEGYGLQPPAYDDYEPMFETKAVSTPISPANKTITVSVRCTYEITDEN